MESQEIKTWKDCHGLSLSVEWDKERKIKTYFVISIFNGDMRWSFDEHDDAMALAVSLKRSFEKCFDFQTD
ncbi:MAG: hypothetical protein ACXADW_13580 [Candidatus Hodarchaeales archaeon]|jgi:hypothetical protein